MGPSAALAGLAGRPGDPQSDPIQTLQDIGKTLAQLNITVEAAVNAGLLGGLSASGKQ
jgi:TPP-dependent indolepyruvate ferredoxin oxidoreductase alpha subunit